MSFILPGGQIQSLQREDFAETSKTTKTPICTPGWIGKIDSCSRCFVGICLKCLLSEFFFNPPSTFNMTTTRVETAKTMEPELLSYQLRRVGAVSTNTPDSEQVRQREPLYHELAGHSSSSSSTESSGGRHKIPTCSTPAKAP